MQSSRTRVLFLTLAIVLAAGNSEGVLAQLPETVAPSDTIWEFRLTDGSALVGQVSAATAERVTIRTASGITAEIERTSILSVRLAAGTIRDGRLWPADPNRTRLFFGPTARMLDRGEGYVGAFELFFPFASFGVTNHLTLAGGTPVIPEVIGRVWYFAPKVGTRLAERTWLSAGVLGFINVESGVFDDLEPFGIAYLAGTQGSENTAASLGVGWGFAGTEVQNRPMFLLGAEHRASPRIKLLSENYFVTYRAFEDSGEETRVVALLSGGIRVIGERLSADAGIGAYFGDGDSACCLPLVNFVYTF